MAPHTGAGGVIRQGVDCWIEANSIINVRTGLSMDVTGCSVHAVARARYERVVLGRQSVPYRFRMYNPIVAEWDTTPTGTQGTAVAGGAVPDQVQLHVTPTQTLNWRCPLVVIQAELTDPITGYVERIIDEVYEVSFEAIDH
jgi:hypothetical protein